MLSPSFLFSSEVGFLSLLWNCRFFAKLLAKFICCLMFAKLVLLPT